MARNLDKRLTDLERAALPTETALLVCWPDPANPERLLTEVAGELVEYIPQPGEKIIRLSWGAPDPWLHLGEV